MLKSTTLSAREIEVLVKALDELWDFRADADEDIPDSDDDGVLVGLHKRLIER